MSDSETKIMGEPFSVMRSAMRTHEIRNMITQNIPVTPEGLASWKICGLVDHMGSDIRKQCARKDVFFQFESCVPFIDEVKAWTWPLRSTNWERLL